MAKTPTPGSAAEHVSIHGIASLRGVALKDGSLTIFIPDNEIDRLIAEEAEDKATGDTTCPVWRQRTQAGETPNAALVYSINLNTVVIKPDQEPSMDHFKDLLQQYLNDPKNTAEAEHLGSMKALVSYRKEDDHWLVKCDFPGADGLTRHKVDGEDLFGWIWQKVKTLVAMPGTA